MPADQTGDPWSGSTYHGFAGGPRAADARREVRSAAERAAGRRRTSPLALIATGVGCALVLGLGFGFLARPHLDVGRVAPAAAPSPAPAAEGGLDAPPTRVPIDLGPAARPEPPRSDGRLQVLPPRMMEAARDTREAPDQSAPQAAPPTSPQAAPRAIAPPRMALPPPTSSGPYFADVAPAPAPMQAPVLPPPQVAPASAPQLQASFDCATAQPGAEQMICAYPRLAAADRELARAYRRAMQVTSAPDELRSEQRDWMAIREEAARSSPQAVGSLYDQRIRDLNQLAAEGDDADADYPVFDRPR